MNTALVLLEIQNDYFPNGRIPLEKSIEATEKAQTVLHAYREKKMPVVFVQQISTNPNANHFLPCTIGAGIHQMVQPLKNEIIVKKHYPNSFKDTVLGNYLLKNRIQHLVICGMMTHMAVEATVRAAYDMGFSCTVLHDACAARQVEFNHTTISAQNVHLAFLGALQPTYASVMSTEEFLQRIGARSLAEA